MLKKIIVKANSPNQDNNLEQLSQGRQLQERSFLRCLLYGTALAVGFHIALAGVAVNLIKNSKLETEPNQTIDFLILESPPETEVKLPKPISPSASPVLSQAVPNIQSAESAYIPSRVTIPSAKTVPTDTPNPPSKNLTTTATAPQASTSNDSSTTDLATSTATTTTTANEETTNLVDRIRALLGGNNNPNTITTNGTNGSNRAGSSPTNDANTQTAIANPQSNQRIRCVRCDKPAYPLSARDRNLEGRARVAVDVDSNGNVVNVRLIESSGHGELDQAALEQARRWQFTPSLTGRQGINGKIDFQLEGSEYQRQRRQETPQEVPRMIPREATRANPNQNPSPPNQIQSQIQSPVESPVELPVQPRETPTNPTPATAPASAVIDPPPSEPPVPSVPETP